MDLKKNVDGLECVVNIDDNGNMVLKVYSNDLVYFDTLPVGRKQVSNLNWNDAIKEKDIYSYTSYSHVDKINIDDIDKIFGDTVKYINDNKVVIEDKPVEDLSEIILQKKNAIVNSLLVKGYEEEENKENIVDEIFIKELEYK